MILKRFLLLLTSFALLCPLTARAAPPKLIAYLFGPGLEARQSRLEQFELGRLTHLNYAFANIAEGELVAGTPALELGDEGLFAQLRAQRKRYPKLKTLISVGGWTWSKDFSDVALTEASRQRFALSAVRFLREHGFDGVDVDWEFPVEGGEAHNTRRPEDKANFTLLMAALRTALDAAGKQDGRPYLLTAAVGNNATYLRNTDVVAVSRLCDWLNVMTYDFAGPWELKAGHVAPLYASARAGADAEAQRNNVAGLINRYLELGIPPARLVLGLPFYGYSWQGCVTEQEGEYQSCAALAPGRLEPGAVDTRDIAELLREGSGFARHWSAEAAVPWLFNPASGRFVTFDDAESLRRKVAFARRMKLGGYMFWEMGADPDGVLLRALDAALRKPVR